MTKWETSIDVIIRLFRDALVALIPIMEKANIAWREGDAYDDWDEIAQALYRNIVGRSIQSALGGDVLLDTLLPEYNMKLLSYSSRNVVAIRHPEIGGPTAFIGLSTNVKPFDTVDYVRLDSKGEIESELLKMPLEKVTFVFICNINREQQVLNDLQIDL